MGTIDDLEVRWEAGAFQGPPLVLERVVELVVEGERVALEPVGPFFDAGTGEAWRAYLTLEAAVDEVLTVEGDEDLEPPGSRVEGADAL